MMNINGLTIGKAAREAGVGVETIRFYERKGLIEQPCKPAATGFRSYSDVTIQRIRFIRQAQGVGFSLREVGELLDLRRDPNAGAAEVRARATAKLAEVSDKMQQLRHMKNALETLIATCPGRGALGCCSIMEAFEGHG